MNEVKPRRSLSGPPEYLRGVNREHEAILKAIESADPEAARAAIRQHLGLSREALQSLRSSRSPS